MPDREINLNPASANELKANRPDLRKKHFECVRCKKEPRGLQSYGMHDGGHDGDILSGTGAMVCLLLCHGDTEEQVIPFKVIDGYIDRGEKIPAFDNVNRWPRSRIIKPEAQGFRIEG